MGSVNREPDEILQNHIEHMGIELGTYFNALSNEVAWLYTKWSEYDELFGKKPPRVDLLNNAAPTFFYIVEKCLFDDILLHIARLTDPPKTGRKKRLSILSLPNLISSDTLKKEIEGLIETTIEKADFCRDWRNRRIAHTNLKLLLSEAAVPLKPASRKKVKAILESISSVMNVIAREFMDSTIIFDGLPKLKGAEALLYILDDGIKAEKRRRERIMARQFTDEDIKPRSL